MLAVATCLVVASSAAAHGGPQYHPDPPHPPAPKEQATTNGLPLTAPTWTPIPISASSHPLNSEPWMNKPIGLAKNGFVEEEFLVTGPARVYASVPNTEFKAEVINNTTYTTRAIVRRPANMKTWSGNVDVEYMNATDGIDDQIMWGRFAEDIFQANDVWVGFTGKPNIIPVLQKFDPARYSTLTFTNPVPPAQQKCGKLPGEAGFNPNLSKLYENGLLWDIWSEVGLSLKGQHSPLGRPASDLYAVGESQSSQALMNYYRWFGGTRTVLNNRPIYDGYFGETGAAVGTGVLNQCQTPLPTTDPQRSAKEMPERGSPYFGVNSQWDAPKETPPASRTYRDWQVAGADHVDRQMYAHLYPREADLEQAGILGAGQLPWFAGSTYQEYSPMGWDCNPNREPEVGMPQVESMAFKWLKAWVGRGIQPPIVPYLKRTEPGGPYVLDADGNALGGLRLPYIEAPIAKYVGGFFGTCTNVAHFAFTTERIAQLYPTHAEYVSKVTRAARESVRNGFLSPEAAQEMVYESEERPIP
jgi:hypothetical protein